SQWAIVIACRWIAWLILLLALFQVWTLVSLVIRPRRKTLITSYIGVGTLLLLFSIWMYYMSQSANLEDAMRPPTHRAAPRAPARFRPTNFNTAPIPRVLLLYQPKADTCGT